MTAHHCAYSVGSPLPVNGAETIDHFLPEHRGANPELAYTWENLHYACSACQLEKRELIDCRLLRPDLPGYEFERYFYYNVRNGDIEVNPGAIEDDQRRAKVTIEILGLNRRGRPAARKHQSAAYLALRNDPAYESLEVWPFRFILTLL